MHRLREFDTKASRTRIHLPVSLRLADGEARA
jgi:hypothetical protein